MGMRTVYLGTSEFAVRVLSALAASPHRPALVVTPPDRPRGRGRRLASPPVADAARELGIEALQVESVNDGGALERIGEVSPGAVCVCEFGQLIKEPLLSRFLILNVHPSLLPRWRGAAPIERALMAGDETTGVTIFKIEAGLDSGPIALARELSVVPGETAGALSLRLADLGAELLIEALDLAEAGTLELTEQPEEGVTYAGKIDSAERRLDTARPAVELERVVRALTPEIGAFIELDGGERLGVVGAQALGADALGARAAAGEVAVVDGRLLVGTATGTLELLEVKPAGGRAMPAGDYLRGHRPAGRVA
jgi:methionyl-tRNA formyltransferase